MKTILLAFLLLPYLVLAQNKPGSELHIKKAKGTIQLDGIVDEADWADAQVANNWFLNYPVDTARAPFQTETLPLSVTTTRRPTSSIPCAGILTTNEMIM